MNDNGSITGQFTKTGKSKRDLIIVSCLSYGSYDVPPNFNLDPRVRVQIGQFHEHWGHGKWINYNDRTTLGQAFAKLVPEQPGGEYLELSEAYPGDSSANSIFGGQTVPYIQAVVNGFYTNNVKGLSAEMDFNFGQYGLEYYLYTKMLWNPNLTVSQLTDVRSNWLVKCYGNAASNMDAYYTFIKPLGQWLNGPANWGRAIKLLDGASQALADGTPERKRVDDMKQFWYFYYLVDTGNTSASNAFKEFAWKGQMSYITCLEMVCKTFFGGTTDARVAGGSYATGQVNPAHYTSTETATWWGNVTNHWPYIAVTNFADGYLVDGTACSTVDLYDLVRVAEFDATPKNNNFVGYGISGWTTYPVIILTTETNTSGIVGCSFSLSGWWSSGEWNYEVDHWNGSTTSWDLEALSTAPSQLVTNYLGLDKILGGLHTGSVVNVMFSNAVPGTYRILLLDSLFEPLIDTLQRDWTKASSAASYPSGGATMPMTLDAALNGNSWGGQVFYIPMGVKVFDLDAWGPPVMQNGINMITNTVKLFKGLPTTGLTQVSSTNLVGQGNFKVQLNQPSDPRDPNRITFITYSMNTTRFYVPYVYSVPMRWAGATPALMVPRKVAQADGLTILSP